MLAITYADMGDMGKAIEQLRAAVDQRPDYVEACYRLGSLLKDQGDVDGAIAALRRSVALDDTDAGAFNNLGLLLRRKGDMEGAKVAFAKAAEIRKAEAEQKEKHLNQGTPH